MLATLAATISIVLAPPSATQTRVVAASLFKNGFAVVVREVPLASGRATLAEVPGRLWERSGSSRRRAPSSGRSSARS